VTLNKRSGKIVFPDPHSAGEDGLLCVGGNLEIETLCQAYRLGIFPWPHESYPMLWFCPENRGVLDFNDLHWPMRFLRSLKNPTFRITFDRAFSEVIKRCAAKPRAHEAGTWILPQMQEAYVRMHEAGYAHSAECWQGERLVGGLYGVFIDGVFSGESMFYEVSDASKRCLFAMIEKLRGFNCEWMDIQMVTPVLEDLGGKYIMRDEYLDRLGQMQEKFGHLAQHSQAW
jgi:leucyl/phenylalanyl-tRNA--protein transferase